ncbi:MAG: DUF3108 domain-containing protein [Ignavibacteria bacterium]|nr:DUF3108 domain-containing protein [Ignavibacteria bacterium]
MKNFITVVLIVLVPVLVFSQDTIFRKVNNVSFKTGEHFEYELNYGFITGGYAILEVKSDKEFINGRRCYLAEVNISTTPSFDYIYRFRQIYKCYLDYEGIFPWLIEQDKNENGNITKLKVQFDNVNNKVLRNENGKETEFDIIKYTLDDIGVYYYSRTIDFSSKNPGETVELPYLTKDKSKVFKMKYTGKETVEVPAGEFRCIVIEPLLREAALASKVDNIVIWITDDDNKMPVLLKMDIIIGSVTAELKNFWGLSAPLKSKVD